MRMHKSYQPFLAALTFAFSATAFAQANPDAEFCAGSAGTADERVAACTRAITSGKLTTRSLAVAFYNRGVEWTSKRDWDRAIADYTEALRHNPLDADSHNNRGNAFSDRREYDKAIADYNEAIRLKPNDPTPYNGRGNAVRNKGDYDRAIADYDEALRLNPKFSTPSSTSTRWAPS